MKFSFIEWLVAITILVIMGVAMLTPYFECHAKAKAQGLECHWGILQGCMVNVDGRWIDYARFRIMD